MKQQRIFPPAVVSPRAELSIRAGHPWVYDTEVRSLAEPCENGGLVDVLSGTSAFPTPFGSGGCAMLWITGGR